MTRTEDESETRILYCRCKYAKGIPESVKNQVLSGLNSSKLSFDAVPDLCEMSARKDHALVRLAASKNTKIIACYARAVHGLFHAAGSPLIDEGVEILNMREMGADEILDKLTSQGVASPTEAGA